MNKVKKFMQSKSVKRIFAALCCISVMFTMALPCFAEEGVTENPVSQIQTAFGNVTSTIKISNVVSVIGIVMAAAVGFVLFWWGLRKVIKVIMSACKKGRVSV